MHAYVINLARSPSGGHISPPSWGSTDWSRSRHGVDGGDLDLQDPQIIDPSVLDSDWFRPGVAGCAMSHLRVYQAEYLMPDR